MTTADLLNLLVTRAREYRALSATSLRRNDHMHGLVIPEELPTQGQIDALLTDFINFNGLKGGVDMALYTSDLTR